MQRIASRDNLLEAFLRTARGKETKMAVRRFREHLDENITEIQQQLLDGTYDYNTYHAFLVYDPKQRLINGPSFAMSVVLQAMMRICHPVFDDYQIDGSFASRPGRGQYAALERTQQLAGRYRWFAKLDCVKYFPSIDHEILMQQLCRLFKDPLLLLHFRRIIDSYETTEGKSLPIGNLSSQYFANHYLAVADHWAKQQLLVAALVRYMDDPVFFDNDLNSLMQKVRAYRQYLHEELRLTLHEPIVNQTKFGIPFLGYVVYKDCLRLSARSQQRFRYKLQQLATKLDNGEITEQEYAFRAQCLFAFVDKAQSDGYRRHLVKTYKGIYPQEL